jgi:trimeric autotransporter adhesin
MFALFTRKRTQFAAMLCAGAFLTAGCLLTMSGNNHQNGEPERDEPLEALRFEFEKTRDPRLNTIPRERLMAALKYYADQERVMAKMKTTNGFTTLTWNERGPNNVGGRTRAVLFDANDATGKTVFAGGVGGGLWKCTDITAATPVWTPVNDQFSNLAVSCIAQDPSNAQILYFGTGEGWGNADGIKGDGIWKSTNGGTTWTQVTSTANNNDFAYIQRIAITSSGHVYAACKGATSNSGGLQKSTNGGTSWTRVIGSGSTDMHVADIEVASNGDLYATVGIFSNGKIFKSSYATHTTNVGNTGNWSDITPTGTWQRIEIAVAPGNSSQLYALCQGTGYEVTGIFSSANGGSTWSTKTIPDIYDQGAYSVFTRGQSWYDLMCAVDPSNSNTVYIGGVDMLKSTNGGTTWTQLTSWSLYNDPWSPLSPFPWAAAQNVHADIHTLVFRPGVSTSALVACDGGLFFSADLNAAVGLPSWASKSTNYNVTQYYACAAHPSNTNYFLAGAQDNGSHKFSTTGINTVTEVTGGDGAFCFIDKTNGNNQITSYVQNNYYYSTDGGATFNDVASYDNSGRFINPSDLDGTNDILYAAGGANELKRYANVFSGFATKSSLTVSIGGDQISAIKVSPNTPTTIYVGTDDGRVYRITNANGTPTVTNLTSTQLVAGGYVSSIDVKKRTTNTDDSILVAISNYGVNSVFYTANGTNASPTWIDIDDNNTLQDIPVRWAIWSPVNSKIIFLGTEVGVMGTGTINGGSTVWSLLNNAVLPRTRVDMIQVNSNNQLVVATHGRGLWTSSDISPLSLRLLSFDVKLVNDAVAMEWRVNNDKEASRYIIERSYDGKDFSILTEQAPDGKNIYTLFDHAYDRNQSSVSYRLKVEDVKNNTYYSDVRSLKLSTAVTVFIDRVYPTATSGTVHILAGNAARKSLNVQVIDVLGKIYMVKTLPYSSTSIDLSSLSAGNYLLYVSDESGTEKYFTRIVKK